MEWDLSVYALGEVNWYSIIWYGVVCGNANMRNVASTSQVRLQRRGFRMDYRNKLNGGGLVRRCRRTKKGLCAMQQGCHAAAGTANWEGYELIAIGFGGFQRRGSCSRVFSGRVLGYRGSELGAGRKVARLAQPFISNRLDSHRNKSADRVP